MQLQIPHAPRKVRLSQVPGAVGRLLRALGLGLLGLAVCVAAGAWAGQRFWAERQFVASAVEISGRVSAVKRPVPGQDRGVISVVYRIGEEDQAAGGVITSAARAAELYPGAELRLLVDPASPSQPREAGEAEARAGRWRLFPLGVGLGLLLAIAAVGFELRRTVRSDLEPIRLGALVWLTPSSPLPESTREQVIRGSYLRGEVRHEVQTRVRPKRYPVRNGEKLLVAIVPSRPTWARAIDEDLAKTLGWLG